METKLVYYKWYSDDDSFVRQLVSDSELIRLVDEMDFTGIEILKIYDISELEPKELHYVGWQPNCLIQFADSKGNVVLSGYGVDH